MTTPDRQSMGERTPIGVWLEPNRGDQWAHQGMTRLLGFIIEGAGKGGRYVFHIVLPDYIRDEALADLRDLEAVEGRDFQVHSPGDYGEDVAGFEELAAFANRHVTVAGWLSLFPQYLNARLLNAPLTVIFPDAIPLVFPEFTDAAWGPKGHHLRWRESVAALLEAAERVITFSDHVAHDHVHRLFGVDRSRITSIVGAPPDLATLLPFVEGRTRSPASLAKAAQMLRHHCHQRGWPYLDEFPFEDVPYIAVSTQDRVTKNIRVVADAVDILVRERREDIRLFMTSQLRFGAQGSPLPGLVAQRQAFRDVVSMPDLPRPEHAAFYHAAELAIHPSIFEGGAGTFPFLEANSVGTPCLMADGPHQRELIDMVPGLARFTFDPNDARALVSLIREIRANRAEIVEEQREIYDELRKRTWTHVAEAYASTAAGGQAPGPLESVAA